MEVKVLSTKAQHFLRTVISGLLTAILMLAIALIDSQESSASNAQQLYDKMVSLEKEGRYEESAQTAADLLNMAPQNDSYLAYASHVENLAGYNDRGLQHALAAVRINSSVPWYYASVAFNAYAAGEIDTARLYCRKVVDFGASQVGEGNINTAKSILKDLKERQYTITWTLDPAKGVARGGYYYIPTPTSGMPYQTSQYSVNGASEKKLIDSEGNPLLYFKPAEGESLTMTANVSVKPYSFKKKLAEYRESQAIPDDVRVYLGASEGINPQSPTLTGIVETLKSPDRLTTVKNILKWMKKNISYQIVDFKNVEEIIERGYGECGCWSALFTALCRSAGIPARIIWGVIIDPTPDHSFAPEGHLKGHAWAEFYIAGAGWVPVEPQHLPTLGLLPTSYVRMYHCEMKSRHWTAENFRASDNMVIMGGDTPQYTEK